jgi:hypothetical protein
LNGAINLKHILEGDKATFVRHSEWPNYGTFPTENDILKFENMQPNFYIEIKRAILQQKKIINKTK